MSLSGWRPADTVSVSSRNRDPALGPRCTTSSALPGGRASRAAASWALSSVVSTSPSKVGVSEIVEVVSDSDSGATNRCPHCAQNLAELGFSCPHSVQNGITTSSTAQLLPPPYVPEYADHRRASSESQG